MKGKWESLMLGGAMLFSGLAHKRAGDTERRVEQLAEAVEAAQEVTPAAQAAAPAIPGMPLPTGYGLQVRGPAGESIVVPVCLPPGFELDSMMLRPEFLAPAAREDHKEVPAVEQPVPAADRVEVRPGAERIGGTMQYVFGSSEPAFSSPLEPARAQAPAATEPAQPLVLHGVETHHLV
jgi:hypothetical protein